MLCYVSILAKFNIRVNLANLKININYLLTYPQKFRILKKTVIFRNNSLYLKFLIYLIF